MQGCFGSQVCASTHNTLKSTATPVQQKHSRGGGDLQRLWVCILLSMFALMACQNDGIDNDVDNRPHTSSTSQTYVQVSPFPLDQVSLLNSPFTENRDRTLAYLAFIDADRMLYTFRRNVGLSSNAQPVGGWEAPDHGLRGHSMGHIITALSQAYLSTGDVQYKNKADYIVSQLKICQDASPAAGYSEGYLSAFPEERVFQLERLEDSWAPLYCIHKTIAGLLDAYQLLNNNDALDMAIKMADWIYNRLSQYSHQHLQDMWNFMSWNAGEYGGFNETLVEIYNITNDQRHIDAAKFFDHDVLFDPLFNNQDQLSGMHANTQIPKIIGALRIYEATSEGYYYSVANNFWSIVVNHHSYINGGNSVSERFREPNQIASQLTAETAETCNTYNMLKLTRQLFFHDPQPKYMDYYERSLYNHILASQDPASGHGFVTYFVPMQPGAIRTYSTDYDSFWCCHGTGMENHTKYQDSIYAHTDSTLYVNLFIPSVLNWTERGFTIRQEGSFLTDESTTLIVQGSGQLEIRIRVPSWADSGFVISINNTAQNITASPGTYISLDRTWSDGDIITIETPFSLRVERAPDNDGVGGVMYGPVLLAGDHGGDDLNGVMQLIDMQSANDITDVIQPGSAPLSFVVPTADNLALVPFYKAHGTHYSTYFYVDNGAPSLLEAGYYKLIARHSNKVYCVENASTDDGANVHQWEYINDTYYDQMWWIEEVEAGYYRIINRRSGKGMDVLGFGLDNGTSVVQWEYLGGDNQKFSIEPIEGAYLIRAKHSGRVICVAEASSADGANIHQWDYVGLPDQQIILERVQ